MIKNHLKFGEDELEQVPSRNGYGEGLVELGGKNEDVFVLTADLAESTRVMAFAKKFPERFVECGVAEQNMMGIAAGLAAAGKTPFVSSYAVFSPGRNWDQMRVSVAISNLNVKVAGSHAGLNVGADGATHQALEDIAITRVLPNMTVIVPCDALEAQKATVAVTGKEGPVYLRFARAKSPVFTDKETPFKIGKAEIFWEDKDPKVAIFGCGPVVYEALIAAKTLEEQGIGTVVVNNHTVKPMDTQTVISVAKKTGAVVTVEEHQIAGGMGSAVSEVLAKNYPVPIEFVGMNDKFGESGSSDELLSKYGMKAGSIIESARKVIARKRT